LQQSESSEAYSGILASSINHTTLFHMINILAVLLFVQYVAYYHCQFIQLYFI